MLKVDCFIVPNGLLQVSKRREGVCGPELLQQVEEVYGVKLEDLDFLVQTWTLDPMLGTSGQNNFEDHGVQMDPEKRFPWCAPVKLFAGKKEGDTISFSGSLGTFECTLKQKGYRYERFGTFDEVLNRLVTKAQAYVTK